MRPFVAEEIIRIAREFAFAPMSPAEEAISQNPILIFPAKIEGVFAARMSPGKSVLLCANPDELAGKLRREGANVATGDDARAILLSWPLPHIPFPPL